MRLSRVLPALVLPAALGLAAPAAVAQECSVDTFQPAILAQAGLTIQKAANSTDPATTQKALRDAYKYLQDERKYAANPVGAGFLKGQIYILWLHQDGIGDKMTRDALNAGGVKTESIDLIDAADAAFKAVEALGPGCAPTTAPWRASKPWTDRLNKAYTFLGADAVDSAEVYAKRSAQLSAESPFIHNVFGQIALKRGNTEGLLSHLRLAIDGARGDTSFAADTRRQMQFQYAVGAVNHAMGAGAASKNDLLKGALAEYLSLFAEIPSGNEAASALAGASEIIGLQQDTATARAILAGMVADPSKHDDLTLLLGADMARMGQRNADAMTLYNAALGANPNIRDALYFMTYMYYEEKTRDIPKMLAMANRLIELDPSNPDNYQLHAEALRMTAVAEKDPAKKAALTKEATAANLRLNAMTVKLAVNQFERRKEGAILGGTIENLGRATKSYALTVEFLDTKGEPVESMTTQVAGVAAGASGKFEFRPTKAGIVAYRYKAIN